MPEQFYMMIFGLIAPIIYKLPILGTKKFIILSVSMLVWLPFVLSRPSSFISNEVWIGVSIFIFYVLYLGYKHSKYIESVIILYVNQQIMESSDYRISISKIIEIVDEDLKELSIINDKDKYIKETIEIFKKKSIIPPSIKIIEDKEI